MPKITTKTDLVLGTNLVLHIADKGGTDIAIGVSGPTLTLTSTSTSFVASSTSGGITNRAIVVGDVIELYNTTNAANEGVAATVTAVTANSITATVLSGSPVAEAAGSDVNVLPRRKTFQFLQAGGLSFVDGVAGTALHSRLIDLWSTLDLDRYPPVFSSIEPRAKSMAAINGWEPHDNNTINALRDMALEVRPTATSTATRVYALLRSGNLHAPTDQMTFWFNGDPELSAPNQAVHTGYINQLVLIRDTGASIDRRGNWFVRCAMPGKTILFETLNLQHAEIIPVSSNNAIDPKLADPSTGTPFVSDGTIAAGGVYNNIRYNLDADGITVGSVAGTNHNFAGFVTADNRTNEQVHAKINWLWRQSTNVNSDGTGPVRRGDKQPPLTSFSGNVFTVRSFVQNFSVAQRNDLRLVDNTGAIRQFPLVNSITITAPAIAHGGTFTIYHVNSNNAYGSSNAAVLRNESNVDQRDIPIAASVGIPFSYSTYNHDGHTPNTPLRIRVAFGRPGFIEAGVTDVIELNGSDVTIPLSVTADPSYVA